MSDIKIASFGGGVNSTAMIILLKEMGKIPDNILFADTGGERAHTYTHITHFNKWLINNGMPEIEVVKYRTKHGEELTLEQDVINNNTLPSIVFGWKTCSQKFKIAPQEKFIKERYGKDCNVIMYIGFDLSEERRIKENPNQNYTNVFPLIDGCYDRKGCEQLILDAGLCLPKKSSCFFCPNSKKHEILSLNDDEVSRIKFMESNATKLAEVKGLGYSYKWSDLINLDANQLKIFDDTEIFERPCNCIY